MNKASMMLAFMASAALGLGACDDSGDSDDALDKSGQPGDDAGHHAGNDAGRDAGSDTPRDAGSDTPRDAGSDASTALPLDAAVDAGAARQAVMLRFKGKVGGEDLACGKNYPGQGTANSTITPRDFRFFVHNVRLISAAGVEVPVQVDERPPYQAEGLTLIDFADGTGSCDPFDKGTNIVLTGTVPAGSYTGIAFVEGVPEQLNHADLALHPGPLQAPGVSWGWTLGFRFVMAEVVATGAASGAGVGDAGGASGAPIAPPPPLADAGAAHGGTAGAVGFVHVGSTGCTGAPIVDDAGPGVSCDKPNRPEVRLKNFNPATGSIVADLGAVFSKVDLGAGVQCHGSGPACAPMFEALGVNIETGATLPTQQVFRVE